MRHDELPPEGHQPEQGGPHQPETPRHDTGAVSAFTRVGLAKMLALLDPTTPRKLEEIGHVLYNAGRHTEAEAVYRECIHYAEAQRQAPVLVCGLYTMLADVLAAQNKYEEGLPWLHRAYELADGTPLSILTASRVASQLAEAYRALGRSAEAGHWDQVSRITGRGFFEQCYGPFPER